MQTKKQYNQVIEGSQYTSRVYNITVHPFSDSDMEAYEQGMRAALKDRPANVKAVFVDFSELKGVSNLDEKTVFDMFHFVSFQCLRCENMYIIWGDEIVKYLKGYNSSKYTQWRMSGNTIKKLLDANTDIEYMKELS